MKKVIFLLLFFFLIPINTFATNYSIDDISIDLDDNKWFVFTRDNIYNNKEMEAAGITYEYMNNFFENKKNVYLYSIGLNDDESTAELVIFIKDIDIDNNMNRFSNSKLNSIASKLKEECSDTAEYEIYEANEYVYIKVNYSDNGYNIIDYYTIMNGKAFTIKYQKMENINTDDELDCDNIVKSIEFEYNSEYDKEDETSSGGFIELFLGGALFSLICLYFRRKGKKTTQNNISSQEIGHSFKCDECGASVSEEDDICPNCGASFGEEMNNSPAGQVINNLDEGIKNLKTEEKIEYLCDECGASVSEEDDICPNCGASFDETEKNDSFTNESILNDKKYDELLKLKDLLDKNIITEKEFEKEKKKILEQ